jgi:scytalone dehydratase
MPNLQGTDSGTLLDWLALSRITFEWADSYDSKQFDRMEKILAPKVTVRSQGKTSPSFLQSGYSDIPTKKLDYSEAFGTVYRDMPASSFVKMSSNPNRLGGIVDCIHHVGASKYDRTGPDTVTGYHQVRTEYKRWKTMEKKEVEATGQGLTIMLHYYQRVNGEWKLAGVKPLTRSNEFNFERIMNGEPGEGKSKL